MQCIINRSVYIPVIPEKKFVFMPSASSDLKGPGPGGKYEGVNMLS